MIMMNRILLLSLLATAVDTMSAFTPKQSILNGHGASFSSGTRQPFERSMATPAETTTPDFNSVIVAKEGGRGMATASQQALEQNLSLGAPPARPKGGHFMTKGGIQVTANVDRLEFSKNLSEGTSELAIEQLIDKLDSNKGVLLTSSYEFPGRYARWSLGMVDPPLEVSGRSDQCTIRALNARGKVLMPAIQQTMDKLKEDGILESIQVFQESTPANGMEAEVVRIDVKVVPPPEVGTFSEEERSRQVRNKVWFTMNGNLGKQNMYFGEVPIVSLTLFVLLFVPPFS